MTAFESSIEAVNAAAKAANEAKAIDVLAFDVSSSLNICDAFLIASGDNEPHVLSVAQKMEDVLQSQFGLTPSAREGLDEAKWILLDYKDFIIHVFHKDARKFYEMERLWKDSPSIDLHLEEPIRTEYYYSQEEQ